MSGGGSETNTTAEPWKGVRPYLTRYGNTPEGVSPLYEEVARLYGTGGPQVYQGQTYANQTPLELEGRGLQYNAAMGMQPTTEALQSSLMSSLNAADVANNPYVGGMADMITGRLNRNLSENLMPAASQGAMSAGQLGGGRHGVMQGQAIQGTQQAVGDSLAQLYSNAYDTGMDAQIKAQGLAPMSMQAAMMPGQTVSALGAQDRAFDQAAISDEMYRFNAEQMRPENALDAYTARLMGAPWGSSSSTDSSGNPLTGAIGGGLLGYSGGTALGSAIGGFGPGASMGAAFGPIGAIGGALLGGLLSR